MAGPDSADTLAVASSTVVARTAEAVANSRVDMAAGTVAAKPLTVGPGPIPVLRIRRSCA
jgi:hypothetical protein